MVNSQVVHNTVGYIVTSLLCVGCVMRIVLNIKYLRMQVDLNALAKIFERKFEIIYTVKDDTQRTNLLEVLGSDSIYEYDEHMRRFVDYEAEHPLEATIKESVLNLIDEHRVEIIETRGKFDTHQEIGPDGSTRIWITKREDPDA